MGDMVKLLEAIDYRRGAIDVRHCSEVEWLRSIIVGGGMWLWETAINGYGY